MSSITESTYRIESDSPKESQPFIASTLVLMLFIKISDCRPKIKLLTRIPCSHESNRIVRLVERPNKKDNFIESFEIPYDWLKLRFRELNFEPQGRFIVILRGKGVFKPQSEKNKIAGFASSP